MIGLHILLVGNTMERRPCAQVTRTAEKSSLCACVSITYEEVSWYTLALRRSFRRTVLSGKAVRGINAIFDEHRFCYPVPPRCRQPEANFRLDIFSVHGWEESTCAQILFYRFLYIIYGFLVSICAFKMSNQMDCAETIFFALPWCLTGSEWMGH